MEASEPDVAKKLWSVVRIVFLMLKTGIPKSKIMLDLHFMVKKGKYNAGKAISNLVSNHKLVHNYHFSSLSCRSSDAHLSFISPTEYEFSCSNSPAANFYPFHAHHKRNKHHSSSRHHFGGKSTSSNNNYYNNRYDDVTTVAALQKVLEMLNSEAAEAASSPMVVLPGFGRSPVGRQLRVTDSPFPLKDEGAGDGQIDKDADAFIRRFYKNLKSQKRSMSAVESSLAHNTWVR